MSPPGYADLHIAPADISVDRKCRAIKSYIYITSEFLTYICFMDLPEVIYNTNFITGCLFGIQKKSNLFVNLRANIMYLYFARKQACHTSPILNFFQIHILDCPRKSSYAFIDFFYAFFHD